MCRDHVHSIRQLLSSRLKQHRLRDISRRTTETRGKSKIPSLFTWFISAPECAPRYVRERIPVDGGKYINTRVELGSKGKSKLEKYPSSGGLLFCTGNRRGKERKNDDFRTKRGRCVLARGKNFSSSLARLGEEGERESGRKVGVSETRCT